MFKVEVVIGALLLLSFGVENGFSYNAQCYTCSTVRNETGCRYPERYDMRLTRCDLTALDKTRLLAKEIDRKYDLDFAVDVHEMAASLDLNCLKVVTKVGQKEHILRGCQLAAHSSADICHKIEKENDGYNLQVSHCSRCSTDRCNSVHGMSLNSKLAAILGVAVLFLLVEGH